MRRPPRRTVLTIAQAEPEQVADARRQLKDLLHDWADEEQVDSAVLMISEMTTNVLVHTDGDAVLIAEAAGSAASAASGSRSRTRATNCPTNDARGNWRRAGGDWS